MDDGFTLAYWTTPKTPHTAPPFHLGVEVPLYDNSGIVCRRYFDWPITMLIDDEL